MIDCSMDSTGAQEAACENKLRCNRNHQCYEGSVCALAGNYKERKSCA